MKNIFKNALKWFVGLPKKTQIISAVVSGVVLAGSVTGIAIATAHRHEYSPTTTPATCLEQGYTTYQCECGDTYVDNYVVAKGHTDGEWIVDAEATCTEDGSKHQICSVCDATIKTETLTKLGHTDGEWITDKEATCTEDGSKHQICSVCDATIKTETLTKLGHTDGEWIVDAEATCTEDGGKHQVCSVCDATIKTETLTKLGHADGEWITDKEANCTEDGSKHQVCSVCDATIKTETLTKLGHTDGEWIVDAEATCTEDGSKHQVCSVCDATIKTETLTKLGHTDGDWIVDKEATCTEDGSKHQVCSVCDATIKTETLTKLGHTDGEWIVDKEATCIEYGSKYYICSRCQSNITAIIPLTSHHYKGTTCKNCNAKRVVYNFSWKESYEETYMDYRLITIVVGEEYQLKYSADVTEDLFYDLGNWVFYEPYVVDTPSVISIDENGKIIGLKTGLVGIKNTGYVINSSNDNSERRIYIQVISEYTETEYNDTLATADVIKPGQTIKFYLSNTSDIDTFKFTAPSNYVKVICTYHGDYEGAASGQSRLAYVQILNSNGTLMNSGTNSHDSAGNVYERTSYIDTSTGYIIFKFTAGYSGLLPTGYFTIEIVPA